MLDRSSSSPWIAFPLTRWIGIQTLLHYLYTNIYQRTRCIRIFLLIPTWTYLRAIVYRAHDIYFFGLRNRRTQFWSCTNYFHPYQGSNLFVAWAAPLVRMCFDTAKIADSKSHSKALFLLKWWQERVGFATIPAQQGKFQLIGWFLNKPWKTKAC